MKENPQRRDDWGGKDGRRWRERGRRGGRKEQGNREAPEVRLRAATEEKERKGDFGLDAPQR